MKNVIGSIITLALFIFFSVFTVGALGYVTSFFRIYDDVGMVMASDADTMDNKVDVLGIDLEKAMNRKPFLGAIYSTGINEYYEILNGFVAVYNKDNNSPALKDVLFLDKNLKAKIISSYSKNKMQGRNELLLSMLVFDFSDTSAMLSDFRSESEKIINVTKKAVADYNAMDKD